VINETINNYIQGDVPTILGKIVKGAWSAFSCINGNPILDNLGIKLSIMLFFAVFLLTILQMRTKIVFDKKHIVAFIGAVILLIRVITMLGFEWGWQIGLYDDWILHLLSPPLEHFWNLLFFGCFGYYTLNVYDYYPGILKKILWYIPVTMLGFFVYSSIQWKIFFLSNLPTISSYETCMSDWQNHLIISVICLYIITIGILRYKKYHCYLSAFWTVTLIEHFSRFVCSYNQWNTNFVVTIMNSLETWALPLLILHFINAYANRFEFPKERRLMNNNKLKLITNCDDCTPVKGI